MENITYYNIHVRLEDGTSQSLLWPELNREELDELIRTSKMIIISKRSVPERIYNILFKKS
jgi:hypothetical protein